MINVEINQLPTKLYPKLMISPNANIYIMINHVTGFRLLGPGVNFAFAQNLCTEGFEDYNDKVILRNK